MSLLAIFTEMTTNDSKTDTRILTSERGHARQRFHFQFRCMKWSAINQIELCLSWMNLLENRNLIAIVHISYRWACGSFAYKQSNHFNIEQRTFSDVIANRKWRLEKINSYTHQIPDVDGRTETTTTRRWWWRTRIQKSKQHFLKSATLTCFAHFSWPRRIA